VAYQFRLPDVGEGITEGEILRWLVEPGQTVTLDQPLVAVQTDKAVVELPAPRAGRILALHGAPGDVVPVGHVLVEIGEPDEIVTGEPGGDGGRAAPYPVAKPAPRPARVQAAPATRRLARELGVDLATVRGTGPNGRVVPADVRRAAEATAPAPPPPPGRREVALQGLRRVIAAHLVESWQQVPQVTVVDKVRATELVAVREQLKAAGATRGVRVTYWPLVAKALALALREQPEFNARWEDGRLYVYDAVHVGAATATADGLVVPVIRDVDQKAVVVIADELARLAARAQEGRLTPEELTGSTITITGGGPLTGLFATPLIHAPEVAIVGLYPIRDEAWVVDGHLVAAPSLYLSLTFDHRVVDGAAASRFLARLLGLLEHPATWLLDLR
jgi:pyruvate/2-oxoglutarate dehydrogenase complex dihydrolipoamide acyltransferase (E2) component